MRSGFFKDHLINSKGANNSHIRDFAQDALRDRTCVARGSQSSSTASMYLPASRNGGPTDKPLSTIELTRSAALAKFAARSAKSLSSIVFMAGSGPARM